MGTIQTQKQNKSDIQDRKNGVCVILP